MKRAKKNKVGIGSITTTSGLPSRRRRQKDRASSKFDPNGTAHHEAGHVVVAHVLGLHTDQVTIEPGEGYLGHRVGPGIYGYTNLTRRGRSKLVRDEAVALYAGLAAENRFFGVEFSFDDDAEHGAWGDNSQAVELMRQHHRTKSLPDAIARAQREARRLVRKHSDAIAKLATLLCKRKSLAGAHLQDVLSDLVDD